MADGSKKPQLLLRLAIGVTYLVPVSDRLGILGPEGTNNVEWGNWRNFIDYTTTLMPFWSRSMANIMGGIATVAEFTIAVLLVIGFKTKYAAIASCMLTLSFIFFMSISVGIQKPVNYGVFTACAASLLLSCMPAYKWSVDSLIRRKGI